VVEQRRSERREVPPTAWSQHAVPIAHRFELDRLRGDPRVDRPSKASLALIL
jgi:hypothetical protein